MTLFGELANRLRKFDKEEKSDFTDIHTSSLMAAENLLRALYDLQEDISLFKEMQTPERVLELNKSWEDFARKAKNIAEILEKERFSFENHVKGKSIVKGGNNDR